MSFHAPQFSSLIRGVLKDAESVIPYSEAAVELLLGTAAQESAFGTYLRQLNNGPALGVFQMEPRTYWDIYDNYVNFKGELLVYLTGDGEGIPDPVRMVHDLKWAAIMCRVHYYRVSAALPEMGDLEAQAHYWKDHYNSHLGAGTVEEYIENYHRYVG